MHKKLYYIFILCASLLVSSFFVSHADAASVSFYNELFEFNANATVSTSQIIHSFPYEDNPDLVRFDLTSTMYLKEGNYPSNLWLSGVMFFNVYVALDLPTGLTYKSYNSDLNAISGDGYSAMVSHISRGGRANFTFTVAYIFDNFYLPYGSTVVFGALDSHIYIDYQLPLDYVAGSYSNISVTTTCQSAGLQITTDANPQITSGEARVIVQAIKQALYDSGLSSADDKLEMIFQMLSVMQNDLGKIWQQIADQTVNLILNDNNNHAALMAYLSRMSADFRSDYADIIALLEEIRDAGASEASEADESASQMAESMSAIAESLEVATPSIDGAVDGIDDILTPEVAQGANDLFFWLRGNTMVVTVLFLSVSVGLLGYILYGRL